MADYIVSLKADTSQIKKDVEQVNDSIKGMVTAAKAFAGVFIGSQVLGFFRSAIDEATGAEDALNELKGAFLGTGIEAEAAAESFKVFAGEMQRTTKFGDDQIISLGAQLQALGDFSEKGLQEATRAAIDFSAFYKKDVATSIQLVGKAAQGEVGALKKLGIEVQKGATDAETYANFLQAIAKTAGAAERETQTFTGAMAQLANNASDVLEAIGTAIIKNEDFVRVIKIATDSMITLVKVIEENSDAIGSVLTGAINAVKFAFDNAYAIVAAFVGVLTVLYGKAIVGAVAGFIDLVAFTAKYVIAQGFANTAIATWNGLLVASRALLASLGIGLVIAAVALLVQWVVSLYKEFGSFNNVLTAAGLKFSKFVATITGNEKAAASYERQLQKLGEAAKQVKLEAQGIVDEQAELRKATAQTYKEEAQLREQQAKERAKAAKEAYEKEKEVSLKFVEDIKKQTVNAGKDQFQVIAEQYEASLKGIDTALKNGSIKSAKEAGQLRVQTEQFYADQINKIVAEQSEKEIAARKKVFDEASKDISGLVANFSKLGELGKGEQVGAIGSAITGSLVKGAQGATDAIAGTLGLVADSFLPGIGGFVSQIVGFLAQGPDKVRETITAFIQQIPVVFQNVLLAIPALIQSIADNIPVLIDNFVAAIPVVIDGIIEALPDLLVALTMLTPKIALSFTLALIRNLPQIIQSLLLAVPMIVYEFTVALVDAAWDFVVAVYDAIKSIIPGGNIVQTVTGGGGGGILDSISNFFGFAEGGMVPPGYPNDSFPAKLTSGEAVIPTDVVGQLESFLASGGNNGGNVTVNLVVGEEQLAKVMFNLNRRGFRTS